jgi:hypothetical protein
VFVLLICVVQYLLPSYHRRFALRGQIRPHIDQVGAVDSAVFCYPKRWDSVTFYLQRDDIRVFDSSQKTELMAALAGCPQNVVFVKSLWLNDFRSALPPYLEFISTGRQGATMSVGVVRHRAL